MQVLIYVCHKDGWGNKVDHEIDQIMDIRLSVTLNQKNGQVRC